jgi:hypothetical protein
MQLDAQPRLKKRPWHPGGREAQQPAVREISAATLEVVLDLTVLSWETVFTALRLRFDGCQTGDASEAICCGQPSSGFEPAALLREFIGSM